MGKQPKRNVRRRKKQVIFRLTIGGATDGTVYPSATRVFNWGAIFIATSKIAVTLDNCSKKWYNMSQGDEKNGQNAAQCGGRKQLLNGEDEQHISRRRHRAAVSAAVQPRYESD